MIIEKVQDSVIIHVNNKEFTLSKEEWDDLEHHIISDWRQKDGLGDIIDSATISQYLTSQDRFSR